MSNPSSSLAGHLMNAVINTQPSGSSSSSGGGVGYGDTSSVGSSSSVGVGADPMFMLLCGGKETRSSCNACGRSGHCNCQYSCDKQSRDDARNATGCSLQ